MHQSFSQMLIFLYLLSLIFRSLWAHLYALALLAWQLPALFWCAKTPLHVSDFLDSSIPQEMCMTKHMCQRSEFIYAGGNISAANCLCKIRLEKHALLWQEFLRQRLPLRGMGGMTLKVSSGTNSDLRILYLRSAPHRDKCDLEACSKVSNLLTCTKKSHLWVTAPQFQLSSVSTLQSIS